MKLETAQSVPLKGVTEEQLREAFRDDARRGEFIILGQRSQVYMQASGEADGPYLLEYRDGDADHHFQAGDAFRKEEVERAFLWYLAGDSQWRTEFRWEKLKRHPWWNRKPVLVAAALVFAVFLAFVLLVAFHADVYARPINRYARVVDFLVEHVLPSALAVAATFCAAVTTFTSLRHILTGSVAQGTVVRYKFVEDCYCPVVEFTDRSGSLRRFTSGVGTGKKPYPEGSRVTVVYDPAKQDRAAIRAFWSLWFFPAVLSAFAALFLMVALGIIRHKT